MVDPWKKELDGLEARGLLRTPPVLTGPSIHTNKNSESVLLFCTNDYLGLAMDKEVRRAVGDYLITAGLGAGASRLVSGNTPVHEALERRMAGLLELGGATLFPSGYQANVGTLSALFGEGDIILSDELNHASVIDGCRLGRSDVRVFRHGDLDDLKRKLAPLAKLPGRRVVVTEALFSMDGDLADLSALADLARHYKALLYVDEAHSFGVMGPSGKGALAAAGCAGQADVVVVTFGKAVGVSGAVVACSAAGAALLKSRARSLMYTTAPPPALGSAIMKSLDLIESADQLREKLVANIRYFRERAAAVNLPLSGSTSPIQPMVIGDNQATMEASNRLLEKGIFVQGIRPPTVASGAARLRITICAGHTHAEIDQLVDALVAAGVGS